jgi:hypothetical protein
MDALGAFYFKPGRLAAEAKPLLRKGLARQSGQCWCGRGCCLPRARQSRCFGSALPLPARGWVSSTQARSQPGATLAQLLREQTSVGEARAAAAGRAGRHWAPGTIAHSPPGGYAAQSLGRLGEAEALYCAALLACHKALGSKLPDTLCSTHNLALPVQAAGAVQGERGRAAATVLREAALCALQRAGARPRPHTVTTCKGPAIPAHCEGQGPRGPGELKACSGQLTGCGAPAPIDTC